MTRLGREEALEVMHVVNYVVCDNCDKEEVDDKRANDDTRWLGVRYLPPMSSMTSGKLIGEYCSIECLYAVINEDRLGEKKL